MPAAPCLDSGSLLRNQTIQLRFPFPQNFLIGKRAKTFLALLEVDEVVAAPEAEVGVVGFAGVVEASSHRRVVYVTRKRLTKL